ncbi:MAG: hypothetical protein JWR26_3820 [Pedosphaera sp.]|nr:hypothetical protein [Pedosphaera sp.]
MFNRAELFDGQGVDAEGGLNAGLAEDDAGHDQEHGEPKGGGYDFAEKEMGPGHGAEGDEVVEEKDFAGGPVAQAVVPKRVCDDTATNKAIDLGPDQTGFPKITMSQYKISAVRRAEPDDLEHGDGQKKEAGAPHGVGADFGSGKRDAEGAALPAVEGPQDAGAESEQLPCPTGRAGFQGRPAEDDDSGERQGGGSVALGGAQGPIGAFLHQEGPDGGGSQIKRDVGGGGEMDGEVECDEVYGERERAAKPEGASSRGGQWGQLAEPGCPFEDGEEDQTGAEQAGAADPNGRPGTNQIFGAGIARAPGDDRQDERKDDGTIRFLSKHVMSKKGGTR